MGFLKPFSGTIRVNEKDPFNFVEYKKKIGYVSQNTFLIDNNITNNIAVGIEKKIDLNRIEKVIQMSGLDIFVSKLENNLDTFIGENGSSFLAVKDKDYQLQEPYIKILKF